MGPEALMEPMGEGWVQLAELGVAFGLSALIGLEREIKGKAAGIRTYTVVGFASALFMLVSKYGFTDVLQQGRIVLDPSRVAAQIVSGLGFIGGGIIFVKRDVVHGLTTAASVWLVAAVGSAAGAGLPVLAVAGTVCYFLAILVLRPLTDIGRSRFKVAPTIQVQYFDGRGLLREVLRTVTKFGFLVAQVGSDYGDQPTQSSDERTISIRIVLKGRGDVPGLLQALRDIDGMVAVQAGDADDSE